MIVLTHAERWLGHVYELVGALTVAACAPEPDEPVHATDQEVVIPDLGAVLNRAHEYPARAQQSVSSAP